MTYENSRTRFQTKGFGLGWFPFAVQMIGFSTLPESAPVKQPSVRKELILRCRQLHRTLLSWSYRGLQNGARAFRLLLCLVDRPLGLRPSTRPRARPSSDTNPRQKPMLTKQSRKRERRSRTGANSRPLNERCIWNEPPRHFGPRKRSWLA